MNHELTELVFILDRSGSMQHLTTETIDASTHWLMPLAKPLILLGKDLPKPGKTSVPEKLFLPSLPMAWKTPVTNTLMHKSRI